MQTRLQTSARALLSYLSPRQPTAPAIDTAIDPEPSAEPDSLPMGEILIPNGTSTPEASVLSTTSSTSTSSSAKILLQELIDREVAHARELDARDREFDLLQQELARARCSYILRT